MRTLFAILILSLLLIGCTRTALIQTSIGGSGGGTFPEYSNLYIAHDVGEESDYNITGFPGDEYEVHIE